MNAESMKAGGSEWIGDVPAHWEHKRLKYTSTLAGRIGWQGLTSEEYRTEGVHLVTGTDFKDGRIDWERCVRVTEARWAEATQVQLREGDLLITKDGTVGKVAICRNMPNKASLNSGVMVIRQKLPMSTRFLYWVLESPVFWGWFSDVNAGASTISHLYQADFYNFGFYVPPTVQEQEQVAAVLDVEITKIDRALNLLEQELVTLEQLKKSLIYEAVTKGLDPAVPMKPSGVGWIGDIPEHWEVRRLKFVLNNFDYLRMPVEASERSRLGDTLFPFYGASGVIDHIDRFNVEGESILVGEDGANLVSRNLPIAYFAEGRYWVNNHAHILRPKAGSMRYYFYTLEACDYAPFITGSAQPKLSQRNLNDVYLPVPLSMAEQEQIAADLQRSLEDISRVFDLKLEQLDLLKQRRQSIIFEYVTGKRRVSEVA